MKIQMYARMAHPGLNTAKHIQTQQKYFPTIHLTLLLLITSCPVLANSVDPDQLTVCH